MLTIIGTFMTRSGVFNSVHSFTQSDIGPTFLVFIAVLSVVSIGLLAFRGHLLVAESDLQSVGSREGSILINNLVFVAITFTVFIGTVYPLLTEALQHKKVSVGEPYFNAMALPGGLLVLFLMGVGPMLPWGETSPAVLRRQALVPGAVGLAVMGLCAALGYRGFMPLLTFGLGAFATLVTLRELILPARDRMTEKKEGALLALARSASRAPRRFGGYIVHLGVVIVFVAIAASSSYKIHTSGTVAKGQSLAVGAYQVRFDGLSSGQDPHRRWTAADITIVSPNGDSESLVGKDGPRMNFYERNTGPHRLADRAAQVAPGRLRLAGDVRPREEHRELQRLGVPARRVDLVRRDSVLRHRVHHLPMAAAACAAGGGAGRDGPDSGGAVRSKLLLVTLGVAVLLGALVVVFYRAFGTDPHSVPFMLEGAHAPGFTLKRLDTGQTVTMDQLRGTPVVLNFWSTWCTPCKQEQAVLDWGSQQFGSQVQFLGVVFEDSEENARTYLQRNGTHYPQLVDPRSAMAVDYGVSGVPETYFIDRSGTIVNKYAMPIDPKTLSQHVNALLASRGDKDR